MKTINPLSANGRRVFKNCPAREGESVAGPKQPKIHSNKRKPLPSLGGRDPFHHFLDCRITDTIIWVFGLHYPKSSHRYLDGVDGCRIATTIICVFGPISNWKRHKSINWKPWFHFNFFQNPPIFSNIPRVFFYFARNWYLRTFVTCLKITRKKPGKTILFFVPFKNDGTWFGNIP